MSAAGSGWDALRSGRKSKDGVACQWRVAEHPVGNVRPADFAWHEEPVPSPDPGEVLLETLYLGLAPVMRMYMQGTGAAGERKLAKGDVIHGRGVARILESRHPDWKAGEIVQGQLGWRTYARSAMTPKEKFFRVSSHDLPYALACGVLGMAGLSAHAGYFACGQPRPGDVTVVSGAAGGVGSMVVQMARIAGASKVVGIAGGPEKCRFVRELGCDDVIDYKNENVAARLAEACPEGIDYYFDNVGGEILSACLDRLAMGARISLCGSISEYTRATPFGLTNYTRLRAVEGRMSGFFVYNHVGGFDEVMAEMAGWIRTGQLKPVQDVVDGFESMPEALSRLYEGKNIGVQCCRVRPEPPRPELREPGLV